MNVRSSQGVFVAALAGVALLILAVGMFLVVMPQRSHVHRLAGSVTAEQAQLAADRAPQTPASPVVIDAADLFRLAEAMPNTDRMPEILLDLSTLARKSKVDLLSIKPSTEVPLSGYTALPLAVEVSGKYANVTAFTGLLRNAVQTPRRGLVVNGRLFIVNQIQLSSSDGRTVTANMNLDAFDYVPAPATAPGTPGAATTTTTTTAGG